MKKILIVDDDRSIRDVLQKKLTEKYEVETAVNGVRALKLLQKRTFDIALVDITMPEMDGIALLRELRRQGINTGVIMLSGVDKAKTIIEVYRLGIADFIQKPVNFDELHESINRLLQARISIVVKEKSKTKELLAILNSLDFFTVFTKTELNEIVDFCRADAIKSWREGDIIIRETEKGQKLFFLFEGAVEVMKEEKPLITMRRRGDIFGEMSVLDKSARSATVKSGADCRTLELEFSVLESGNPGLFAKLQSCLHKIVVNRLRQTTMAANKRVDELKELNAQLQNEIERRKKLEHELAKEKTLSSLNRMVASIAHEMRQPLTSADVNLADLVDLVDGEAKEIVQSSRTQVKNALSIIHSLMKVFRGNYQEKAMAVDVNSELKGVLRLMSQKTKGVEVTYDFIDNGHIRTCANLSRIFINIIDNALSVLQGQGKLKLVTGHSGGNLAISIEDDALGIPQEDLPYIFNPDFTTKKSGEGTGLGLWLAQQEITSANGKITVESEEGLFTRFTILIPKEGNCGKAATKKLC